jgi:hypothetical protein
VKFESTTILRTSSDVVRLNLAGEEGPLFVLQLGDVDENVVVREGGELVFAFLELCDGTKAYCDVVEVLQSRFAGHETLWSRDLPEAVGALLGWRVIEVVGHEQQSR